MCCCGCSLAVALVEMSATSKAGSELPTGETVATVVVPISPSSFEAGLVDALSRLPKRLGDWIMWPAHRAMRMSASAQGSTNG